jgi:ribonuclease HI
LAKVYFDGGCRPNPGPIETAVVARGKFHHRAAAGHGSSEEAEWLALLDAVALARALGIRDLVLLGDCAGVVAQANSTVKSGNDAASACHARFVSNTAGFDRVRVRHIKRSQNLAGIALGQMRQGRKMKLHEMAQEGPSECSVSPRER